jgi:hypothetical protein
MNSRDALTVVENGTPSETALVRKVCSITVLHINVVVQTMVTRTTNPHDRKRPAVDNRMHRESVGIPGGIVRCHFGFHLASN